MTLEEKFAYMTIIPEVGGYRFSDGKDWHFFNTYEEAMAKSKAFLGEIIEGIKKYFNCDTKTARKKFDEELNEMLVD